MKQIKHKHHIIPKHAGGSNDPSNLVELTIEEHAEAHRKLYLEHGRWQDRLAWQALSGMIEGQDVLYEAVRNRDTSYMQQPEFKNIMKKKTTEAWAKGKMDNRTYSEEGLNKIKSKSSETGRLVHRRMIENDWHRNGPGK